MEMEVASQPRVGYGSRHNAEAVSEVRGWGGAEIGKGGIEQPPSRSGTVLQAQVQRKDETAGEQPARRMTGSQPPPDQHRAKVVGQAEAGEGEGGE